MKPPIPPTQQISAARQIQMLPTRDPSRLSFRVSEPAQTFNPADTPKQGDRYGSTRLSSKPRSEQPGADGTKLKDYTYQYCGGDGDTLWFYFTFPYSSVIDPSTGLPLSDVPFNSFNTNKRWSWPTVLHSLRFVDDPSRPIVTNAPNQSDPRGYAPVFTPSVYVRMITTSATNALCECVVEQFCSDQPWEVVEHPQPVEDTVEWDFAGSRGGITCLHPKVVVPSRGNAYRTVVNGTVKTTAAPISNERVYPATNFEDWEPFVLSDEITRENGVYFRERVTIYPPAPNDRVIE
jgi:hypothetical protein